MNERIKELVEWAEQLKRDEVSYRERLHNRYCTGDMEEEIFREKFAELIVKECYESCRSQVLDKETADTNELTYNDAVGDCAIGLLQHFEMME